MGWRKTQDKARESVVCVCRKGETKVESGDSRPDTGLVTLSRSANIATKKEKL